MQPQDFLNELGNRPEKNHVVMLAVDVGRNHCLVEVPHFSFDLQRDCYVPADWVGRGPKILAEIDKRVADNRKVIESGKALLAVAPDVPSSTPTNAQKKPSAAGKEPKANPGQASLPFGRDAAE